MTIAEAIEIVRAFNSCGVGDAVESCNDDEPDLRDAWARVSKALDIVCDYAESVEREAL